MPIVTVNGRPLPAAVGDNLAALLRGQGLQAPCGGHGRCGKCRVTASGALSAPDEAEKRLLGAAALAQGVRLACRATVRGDCTIRLTQAQGGQVQLDGAMRPLALHPAFAAYGLAVDIGTTTLAARLYDTAGRLLADGSCWNPQAAFGADVISRIEAALAGNGPQLAAAVRGAIDELLCRLAAKAGIDPAAVDGLAVTGNTTMLHLLTGTSVEPLSHAPFAARRLFGEVLPAAALGLAAPAPDAQVYLAPCAAAFVGGDLVTALLATDFCGEGVEGADAPGADGADTPASAAVPGALTREDKSAAPGASGSAAPAPGAGAANAAPARLLADIGTNGELALWRDGRLYCCSTAAGPAFEGAGLSMGMGGRPGAVDRLWLQDGRLCSHVIGDGPPQGLCGSGVLDAVACLLQTGQLDETGLLEDDPTPLAGPVSLSGQDIRMVQLAKSAICAGIQTLLHTAGLNCGAVGALYIAGGFGSFLSVDSAARVGLFPAALAPRVQVVGNAALGGASMLLLDGRCRARCQQLAADACVVELSGNPVFADAYMEGMLFEE